MSRSSHPPRFAVGPFTASSARVDGVASSSAPVCWTRLRSDAKGDLLVACTSLPPAPIRGAKQVMDAILGTRGDETAAKAFLLSSMMRPTVVSSLESGALSVFELLVCSYLIKAANTFKKKGIDGHKFLSLRHNEIRDLLKGEPTDEDAVYRLVVLVTRLRRCQPAAVATSVTDIDPTAHVWKSPITVGSLPASVRWRWCTELGARVRQFDHKGIWQTLKQMDRETRVPYADCHELIPLESHCNSMTTWSCVQVADFLVKQAFWSARPVFHEAGIDGAALCMMTPARSEQLLIGKVTDTFNAFSLFLAIDNILFPGDPTPCPRIQPTDEQYRHPRPPVGHRISEGDSFVWRWRRWSTGEVTPVRQFSFPIALTGEVNQLGHVWLAIDQMGQRQRAECEQFERTLPRWGESTFKVHLPSSAAAIQCLRQCFGSKMLSTVPAGEQCVLEASPLDDQVICVRWRDTPGKSREFFVCVPKGRTYEWLTIANMPKSVRSAFEQLRITEVASPSSTGAAAPTTAPPKAAAATTSASSDTPSTGPHPTSDRPTSTTSRVNGSTSSADAPKSTSSTATATTSPEAALLQLCTLNLDAPRPTAAQTALARFESVRISTGAEKSVLFSRKSPDHPREFYLRAQLATTPAWMNLDEMPTEVAAAVRMLYTPAVAATSTIVSSTQQQPAMPTTTATPNVAVATGSAASETGTSSVVHDLLHRHGVSPSDRVLQHQIRHSPSSSVLLITECAKDIPRPSQAADLIVLALMNMPDTTGIYTRRIAGRACEFLLRATPTAVAPTWMTLDQMTNELRQAIEHIGAVDFKEEGEEILDVDDDDAAAVDDAEVSHLNESSAATKKKKKKKKKKTAAASTTQKATPGPLYTTELTVEELIEQVMSKIREAKSTLAEPAALPAKEAVLLQLCTVQIDAPRQTAAEAAIARLETHCIAVDKPLNPIVLHSRKSPDHPREFYMRTPPATMPAWMNLDEMRADMAAAIRMFFTPTPTTASTSPIISTTQETHATVDSLPPLLPIFYTFKSHPLNPAQVLKNSTNNDKIPHVPTEQEWCDYILKEEMVENDGPARRSSAAVARDVGRVTAADLESSPKDAPLPTILSQLQSNDDREQLRGVRALSAMHDRPTFTRIVNHKKTEQPFLVAIIRIVDRTKNTETRCAAINLCKLITMVIFTPLVFQTMVKLDLVTALIRFIKTSDFTVDLARAKRSAWIVITNIAKSSYEHRGHVIYNGALDALATCDVHPLVMPRTMANLLLALIGNSLSHILTLDHCVLLLPVIERLLHVTDPGTLGTVVRVLLVMLHDAKCHMSETDYAVFRVKCVDAKLMMRFFVLLKPKGPLMGFNEYIDVVLECCTHFVDVKQEDGTRAFTPALIGRITSVMMDDKSRVASFADPAVFGLIERIADEVQNSRMAAFRLLLVLATEMSDTQFRLSVSERFLSSCLTLLPPTSSSAPRVSDVVGVYCRAFLLDVAVPNCHARVIFDQLLTDYDDITNQKQHMAVVDRSTTSATCVCDERQHQHQMD